MTHTDKQTPTNHQNLDKTVDSPLEPGTSSELSSTSRHQGRPVHPECAALSSKYANCTCPLLWGYSVDISKLKTAYERLDRRTKWGRLVGRGMGRGPDQDEYSVWGVLDNLPTASSEPNPARDATSSELEATGFWKESEFLQTFVKLPTDKELDKQDDLEYPS